MTENLERVLQQLQSGELMAQIQASDGVVEFGSEAVEPLIALISDESQENVWWLVAEALGKIGDKRAVEPLITILKSPSTFPSSTRRYVAWALGDLRDSRAIDVLIEMLHDRDWDEHEPEGTLYQTDEPDNENVEAASWALSRIREWRGTQAVIDRLLEGNWWYDHRMGDWGGEEAYQYLLMALSSENSTRRARAASLLGEFGDKRAIEPLLRLLRSDKDERVRSGAAYGIAGFQDPSSLIDLLEAIQDEYYMVRFHAAGGVNALLQPTLSTNVLDLQREQMMFNAKNEFGQTKLEKMFSTALQDAFIMRVILEFISEFYQVLSPTFLRNQLLPFLDDLVRNSNDKFAQPLAQTALTRLEKRLQAG